MQRLIDSDLTRCFHNKAFWYVCADFYRLGQTTDQAESIKPLYPSLGDLNNDEEE
jgi:hypothetical protein